MTRMRRLVTVGAAALAVSIAVPASQEASAAATRCNPRVIDMGTLGGPGSEIDGSNRLGDFVGSADTADGSPESVAWFGGRMRDLGIDGWAADVTDYGLVVGNADAGAFYWSHGQAHLLPVPSWASGSYVRRVNVWGDASGAVFRADGTEVPVEWLGLRVVRVLPTPAGFSGGEGLGINDQGDIVGDVSSDSDEVAWEWDHTGASHALAPEYRGGLSQANVVNDRGWAGGGLDFGGQIGLWASVWRNGTVRKLNDVVDPDYSFAFGGDDVGDYVGTGVYTPDDQALHVFLTHVGLGRTFTLMPLSGNLADGSNAHAVVPPHGTVAGTTVGGISPDSAGDLHATVWTCAWQQAIVPPSSGPSDAGPRHVNSAATAARPALSVGMIGPRAVLRTPLAR